MDEINEKFWQLAEAYAYALKEKLGEKLVSVVLFGSVARKEADRFSDVDLIVVCHDLPRTRLSRTEILEEPDRAVEAFLESLWKQGVYTDVIPILKTPEEAEKIVPLYFDLVEDAVILFDRENFFARILERVKSSLERLHAQRRRIGSIRYWDLKPNYSPGEIFQI